MKQLFSAALLLMGIFSFAQCSSTGYERVTVKDWLGNDVIFEGLVTRYWNCSDRSKEVLMINPNGGSGGGIYYVRNNQGQYTQSTNNNTLICEITDPKPAFCEMISPPNFD